MFLSNFITYKTIQNLIRGLKYSETKQVLKHSTTSWRFGNEGGRVGGGGDRNNLDTVHGRAIYCDAADSGAVLGSRLAAGS